MRKNSYLLIGAVLVSLLFLASSAFALVTSNITNDVIFIEKTQTRGPELEVTTDKNVYKIGKIVTMFFTNIGDQTLSGGGPIVSYYNEENELVYQEAVYCWWELDPDEYFTWTWDQKDFNNKQVPVGEYAVEGYLSGGENGFVDTATFYIVDQDPPGPPVGPTEGRVNESYMYCIELPDEIPCEPYYVIWDWGDGDMSEWSGPYTAGETVCANHSWNEPGSYEVKAGIKDGCGREYWTDPLIVIIYLNKPPSAPIIKGPTNGIAGVEYEYTFNSTDDDNDEVTYYINWGDDTDDIIGPYPSGVEAPAKHTWTSEGSYIIQARTQDEYGEYSDPGTLEVTMPKNKILVNSLFLKLLELITSLNFYEVFLV
jgi:hypothetical protein